MLLGSYANAPRMPPFRDNTLIHSIAKWMKRFGAVTVDEWDTTNCYNPYSSTEAVLIFYNPSSFQLLLFLLLGTALYGAAIYLSVSQCKVLRKKQHKN